VRGRETGQDPNRTAGNHPFLAATEAEIMRLPVCSWRQAATGLAGANLKR